MLPCVQWAELWEDIVGRPNERIPGGGRTAVQSTSQGGHVRRQAVLKPTARCQFLL